jgi:exonuclease III
VLADRLISATPDKDVRGEDQPSDHVPVLVTLED